MTTFLPKGYESLRTEKAYWKMSQMKDGDNRLRIVMQPIAGWLDWEDKKPIRYRPDEKPSKSFDPEKPIRAFWDCYVWDYAREGLFVLEITQSSILKALTTFAKDEDWGDFTKYDLKISKEGNGKETRYSLTPLPHKPFAPKIEEALKRSPIRLEALYDGGDPWTDLTPLAIDRATSQVKIDSPVGGPFETLKELLDVDGIDTTYLTHYINDLSKKKGQPFDIIVTSALMPDLLVKFKQLYLKDLVKRSDQNSEIAV